MMSIIGEAATAKVNIPEPTAPYVKYVFDSDGKCSLIKPVGCTVLWDYMFYRYDGTVDLSGSPGYTRIGTSCFDTTNIEEIILPNTVTSLSNSAFAGCSQLRVIDIGTGVTEIPNYCFSNDAELTTVILRRTGTYIVRLLASPMSSSTGAFRNCSKLEHIYVPSSLVATYQSASYWSEIADTISAIPQGV